MDEQPTAGVPANEAPRVSPAEYADFIRQLELTAIWLHEAHVKNWHGPTTPKQAKIEIDDDSRWESESGGFRAFHLYRVRIVSDETPLAEMDVTFGLRFKSTKPMSDGIFAVFRRANLPVNTWPYLREYLSTTTGRMNWTVFTLPALKRVPPPPEAGAARSAQARRTRSRRKV